VRSVSSVEDAVQIELVCAAQRGDTASFEKLYRRYYQEVYVVARATLKDAHEAEDILQQTFVTAWKKLGSLQQPAAFPAWITRIAINACYSLLRSKNIPLPVDVHEEAVEQEDTDEETMPAVYTERADLRERLARVIDSLSDLQRQAVAMYYFEGLKIEEIASVTGSTANTVKVRLHAARKAIKERVIAEEKKTGERFWGVSGIPLMALSAALAPQFAAMSAGVESPASLLEGLRAGLSGAADGAAGVGGSADAADANGGADFGGDTDAAGVGSTTDIDGAVGGASVATEVGMVGTGGATDVASATSLEAAREDVTIIRQRLAQLEEEDVNLAELQAHIDNHANEVVQMINSWKSSFSDVESALMTSHVSGSYAEIMEETFSGEDYRLVSAHIDDFRARVQTCRQQVQADIVECREQLRLAQMRLHRFEDVAVAGGWEPH
jgi:RNA polymerase sigma-70 factor (ECF subfamily)